MLHRLITLILALVVLSGGFARAESDAHSVRLQLKWHHQFQFAGYYAAKAKGFYVAEGLDVTVLEGSKEHPPIREVLAGKAEFGVSDADLLTAYLQGKPVVALGTIFQHSPYILMTRADSGIRAPSDLRGKTIMLADEQGIVQLQAIFHREGISQGAVNIIPHTWNNQDLIDRNVDAISAYATVEPFQLAQQGVDAGMIRAMDYGVDFYGDTLFTTAEYAAKHHTEVDAFRRASMRGWEYALEHPGEIIEMILAMPGVKERGITRESLQYEAKTMRDYILPGLVDMGHMNPGRWEAIARVYRESGIIPPGKRSLEPFLFDPDGAPAARWIVPLLIAVGAVALVAGVVVLWNLQLRRLVAGRTAELLQANQAKDHFLAVLSHELRTPLTPALAGSTMLESDPRLPEDLREHASTIRRNVELEKRLIDDLLDLTRVARGKMEMESGIVDIGEAMRRAVTVVESDAAAKGVHLHCDSEPGLYVRGDSARLQQVFWNLLTNAVKFTPGGGRVHATCRTVAADARAGMGHVVVTVQDTGHGIEPAALGRIFDAFEQQDRHVTRMFGGLGLGLAICRAIVLAHHGQIHAASDGRSKGSTFTVELPRAAAPQKSAAPVVAPQTQMSDAMRKLRILLVEDHPDSARIMSQLLRRGGHDVTIAHSVGEAMAKGGEGSFDLLVSDLGLPDGSGHDLMRHVHANWKLRGIALSGYGMEDDIRRSREAGFSAHLTKPVSIDRLRQVVHEVASAPGDAG